MTSSSQDVQRIGSAISGMVARKAVDLDDAMSLVLAAVDLAFGAGNPVSVAALAKDAIAYVATSSPIAARLQPEVVAALQHLSTCDAIDELVRRTTVVVASLPASRARAWISRVCCGCCVERSSAPTAAPTAAPAAGIVVVP